MRHLRVEVLRSWLSFTTALPVVVVAAALLAAALRQGGVATGLATLHFYAVGLVMPLAMITAVVTEHRERRLRSGGTLWRPQTVWATHAARLAVATGYAGVGHVLATVILPGFSPPFVALETLVFAGGYAVGLLLWQLFRGLALVVTPLASVAVVGLSFIGVDTDRWYLNPFCWFLRPTLPVFGVEANSLLAAPDSPVLGFSPGAPTLAHLALGAVCFCVAVVLAGRVSVPRPSRVVPRPAPTRPVDPARHTAAAHPVDPVRHTPPPRVSVPRALAPALPWRVWGVLTLGMWAVLALVHQRYGPGTGAAAYGLLAVPVMSSVVGVTGWQSHRDAWRGLVTRPGARRLFPVLFGVLLGVSTVPLLVAGVIAGSTPYQLIVTPGVVAVVLAVTMVCAVASPGAALIVPLFALLWGVVVGGSALAANALWWRTGPWAWVWVVHTHPERWYEITAVTWIVAAVLVAVTGPRMSRHVTA